MFTSIPLEAQPCDVLTDRVDILRVFFDRIGVVKPQVHSASVFSGEPKIHANGLGVANVQITIRLWWKSSVDAAFMKPRFAVGIDDLLDEVSAPESFLVPLGWLVRFG